MKAAELAVLQGRDADAYHYFDALKDDPSHRDVAVSGLDLIQRQAEMAARRISKEGDHAKSLAAWRHLHAIGGSSDLATRKLLSELKFAIKNAVGAYEELLVLFREYIGIAGLSEWSVKRIAQAGKRGNCEFSALELLLDVGADKQFADLTAELAIAARRRVAKIRKARSFSEFKQVVLTIEKSPTLSEMFSTELVDIFYTINQWLRRSIKSDPALCEEMAYFLMKHNGGNPTTLVNSGIFYMRERKYVQALLVYERLSEYGDHAAEAEAKKAFALHKLGVG